MPTFNHKEKTIIRAIAQALKGTVLIMTILLVIAGVYDYIDRIPWPQYSSNHFSEMLVSDLKGNQALIQATKHPLPNEITNIKFEFTEQKFSRVGAILTLKTDNEYYTYNVNAHAKYGIPQFFGWDKVDIRLLAVNQRRTK